jgi:hypothetical protein
MGVCFSSILIESRNISAAFVNGIATNKLRIKVWNLVIVKEKPQVNFFVYQLLRPRKNRAESMIPISALLDSGQGRR